MLKCLCSVKTGNPALVRDVWWSKSQANWRLAEVWQTSIHAGRVDVAQPAWFTGCSDESFHHIISNFVKSCSLDYKSLSQGINAFLVQILGHPKVLTNWNLNLLFVELELSPWELLNPLKFLTAFLWLLFYHLINYKSTILIFEILSGLI